MSAPSTSPLEDLASAVGFQVDDEAAFVPVRRKEQRGIAAPKRRTPLPSGVAARGLDLDDVGAQIRQDLRAIGPGDIER